MAPKIAPTMGLTVSFNNPAANGKPEFQTPAIIEAMHPDGTAALNVIQQGNLRYVSSAAQGTGPGQWSLLPS